jgi:hypothetical protein
MQMDHGNSDSASVDLGERDLDRRRRAERRPNCIVFVDRISRTTCGFDLDEADAARLQMLINKR